jgi:hypothetical protein
MRQELIPANDAIFAMIEEIFAQGIRRPAYPADRWTEEYCLRRFRDLGMENVRREPFEVNYWEPKRWSLVAWSEGAGESSGVDLPCFPLPYTVPVDGLTARLVAFDDAAPETASGSVALLNARMAHLPYRGFLAAATSWYDPDGTLEDYVQLLPFFTGRQKDIDTIMVSSASGLVASIAGYPSDCYEQYVPYKGAVLPKPGVWVSGGDGARLAGMLAEGPVNVSLSVETDTRPVESSNVLGELPGADDEIVAVGSHHDAGWGSAVEDASGVALVLAQAEYWSRVPREERPHRMLFVLHGGHMAGGAGHKAFGARHGDEMGRTVLAVHLEHAAMECVESDGKLASTGRPEPRWWFTSSIRHLESTVLAALEAERLTRSVVVPPTIFGGDAPPTDAHGFFLAGVPAVSMLAAPFYLFDSQDTPDKVDRENLAPITRAAVQIVESTRGESAKSMRDAMIPHS